MRPTTGSAPTTIDSSAQHSPGATPCMVERRQPRVSTRIRYVLGSCSGFTPREPRRELPRRPHGPLPLALARRRARVPLARARRERDCHDITCRWAGDTDKCPRAGPGMEAYQRVVPTLAVGARSPRPSSHTPSADTGPGNRRAVLRPASRLPRADVLPMSWHNSPPMSWLLTTPCPRRQECSHADDASVVPTTGCQHRPSSSRRDRPMCSKGTTHEAWIRNGTTVPTWATSRRARRCRHGRTEDRHRRFPTGTRMRSDHPTYRGGSPSRHR